MSVLTGPASSTLVADERRSLRSRWLQGVSLGVGVQGLGLALSFAAGVVAARLLGPAGLGEYAYALAAAGALSVPAALGFPAVVARFLAVYRGRREWALGRGLLRYADRLTVLAGLVLGIGLMAVGAFAWGGRRLSVFLPAAPLVMLFSIINLRQKTLQALGRPVLAQLPLQVLKPFGFLVAAGGLWLAGAGVVRRPAGAMALWLVSVGLAFLVVERLVRRSSPVPLRAAKPVYDVSEWRRAAFPLLFATSVGAIYQTTDTLLLGVLRPPAEVGLYQVALRSAGLLAVLLGASNWVLAPWFARLNDEKQFERLQHVVTRSTRAVFAFTLLGFLVLVAWGGPLLQVFFGREFGGAYPVLLVLGSATLINVGAGPVVNILAMTGGQRALASTTGLAAVVNLGGCALLIPKLGMMGAAMSFGVAMGSMNLVLVGIVRRRLGINPSVLGRSRR